MEDKFSQQVKRWNNVAGKFLKTNTKNILSE